MQEHDVVVGSIEKHRPETRLVSTPLPSEGRIDLPGASVTRGTVQLVVQIVITVAILGAALYIILGGSDDDDTQNWAFGAAGAIVGYWLSGPTR